MGLTITRIKNTFNVEGHINVSTASYFRTHFAITLNSLDGLNIDINNVTEIDSDGINAIRTIYDKALMWNKPFAIVGKGSKEIYDAFKYFNVA
jgi:ABC-type transporter Mla MlaB component